MSQAVLKNQSAILSEQEAFNLSELFDNAPGRQRAHFNRLYCSQVDGYNYNAFIGKARNQTPTVLVIQTADGRKFGASTKYQWGTQVNAWHSDPTLFIFSLNEPNQQPWKCVINPGDGSGVYEYSSGQYVAFGGGNDLRLYFNQQSIANGHSSFARTLNSANNSVTLFELFHVTFEKYTGKLKGTGSAGKGFSKEPFELVPFKFDQQSCDAIKQRLARPVSIQLTAGSGMASLSVSSTSSAGSTATAASSNITSLNVVLLGGTGAGKSSFINSCLSALKGRKVDAQAVRGSDKSVTIAISHVPIPGTPITFWDTMGWDPESYKTGQLGYILDGNVPNKFDLSKNPFSSQPAFVHQPSRVQRAHGACIVIPATVADNEQYLARVSEFRAYCDERQMMPFILLTKIDLYDTGLVDAGFSMTYHSGMLHDLIDEVAKATKVQRSNIIPVKNYESERVMKPEIDVLLLDALTRFVDAACDFIEYRMT